jgi:ATP-dependent RNA helicase DHX8/PRP22
LQDDQEEFEIDLNDDEPEFLKGHSSRSGIEMSPIKIVKNPEGSMQRAAMTAVSSTVPSLCMPSSRW